MDEGKRKKIEAEFRKMILFANRPQEKYSPMKIKHKNVRVIRRRKGSPDFQIA